MSVNRVNGLSVLNARYRCAEAYDVFQVPDDLSGDSNFFEFGQNMTGYGRASARRLQELNAKGNLHDALRDGTAGSPIVLPFDAGEVIENLRLERYINEDAAAPAGFVHSIYYAFRPLMPVGFRKYLQRVYLNQWRRIPFPRWPVDRTVEDIFDRLAALSIYSKQSAQMPFVWFWPQGYSGCLVLTHDVETAAGRDFCLRLADIDASFGFRSSFQIVPEDRYVTPPSLLHSLRARGSEINLHGLNHDGQLFRDRVRFLRDVARINQYAKDYGAAGFRSPVMYRNLEWYGDFDLAYDMSVPNTAHLDPQRGGCCTVMPYFIGHVLELPLTTTQDYTLFHILGERSIDLWKRQIDLVLERHGLLSFNIHPDYIMSEPFLGLYKELLRHLQRICLERNIWIALPGEVDIWWRQRQAMHVAGNHNSFSVAGTQSDRAVVAYARVSHGEIKYEVSQHVLPNPYHRSSAGGRAA